ncbi:MAG: mannonate dehydratase [Lachnospiraceae bacterium]|jgi:mannonate dehydratase|nr:mannonate dehydratase [Lachnospiraceae bacterium]MCR5738812.1 mannonate dehydratase [Lachnospiraceae bacterium]
MEMTLRWYGKEYDTVKLWQIRQIPGVKGVITTLYNKQAGELWTEDEIISLKKDVAEEDMHIAGIESVNISDDIKTAGPKRDEHIDNYIKTLENLGKQDIHMVCYNFMPVFDWTRSELARVRHDRSTVLAYSQDSIDAIDPANMFDSIKDQMNGTVMPGWEPERLGKVRDLFEQYKDINEEKLFENLVYFLKAIMPVCDKYDINMAIHPDDPAWSVFGLPRIINNKANISKMLSAVDNVHNGLTFCSGSFGTNPENDLPDMIRSFAGRVHFAHVRNLQFNSFCHEDGSAVKAWTGKDIPAGKPDFEEAAHLSSDGSFDMYEIVRALYESGFNGPIRPDHGRMIWGEEAMPGYGLYDRALGAAYINGLWEAIDKAHGGVR